MVRVGRERVRWEKGERDGKGGERWGGEEGRRVQGESEVGRGRGREGHMP